MQDLETSYSRARFSTTNYYAIDLIEEQSINGIINERQQQLDAALREISGLETVMDSIKNHRRQLVEKKDKIIQSMGLHKRLVSALWRLPAELLSQNFVYCLPEPRHLWSSSKLAPLLLTKICRRWREVAYWQRIAFYNDLWLKRSRGLPLSLKIQFSGDHPLRFRSIIQPYINQISSLSLSFFSDTNKPELILSDLPALQELTLDAHNRPTMLAIAGSISRVPSTMRSLKIEWPVFQLAHFRTFNPILAHLTNIDAPISQLTAVPRLLHLCPNLSSLKVRAVVNRQIRVMEPFTHTKLQSLRIAHDLGDTIQLPGLFDALSLPSLRLLEARYIGTSQISTLFDSLPSSSLRELEACGGQPWPHEQLKAFLARSNCPLESLIFGVGVTTTDAQRAEYVARIPSLEVVVDPMFCDSPTPEAEGFFG
ncbi:hypothetical protein DFH29DRAFT_1006620 [Suillus ampliporus]|nr:hypothetical protein DFH29DRAFT_1006620 [Suillus ampliporus]